MNKFFYAADIKWVTMVQNGHNSDFINVYQITM